MLHLLGNSRASELIQIFTELPNPRTGWVTMSLPFSGPQFPHLSGQRLSPAISLSLSYWEDLVSQPMASIVKIDNSGLSQGVHWDQQVCTNPGWAASSLVSPQAGGFRAAVARCRLLLFQDRVRKSYAGTS